MIAIDPFSPTAILNKAAAIGPGSTFAIPPSTTGGALGTWTWQTSINGAPTAVSTTLQISLDGSLWETVDTSTNTSGEVRTVSGYPATFIRANLGTLTGGASPTVSVLVVPGD